MAIKPIIRICDVCEEEFECNTHSEGIYKKDGWLVFPVAFVCPDCVPGYDPRIMIKK